MNTYRSSSPRRRGSSGHFLVFFEYFFSENIPIVELGRFLGSRLRGNDESMEAAFGTTRPDDLSP